jgi:hypothetical protein
VNGEVSTFNQGKGAAKFLSREFLQERFVVSTAVEEISWNIGRGDTRSWMHTKSHKTHVTFNRLHATRLANSQRYSAT